MKKKCTLMVAGVLLASLFVVAGCELSVNDPIRFIPIVKPYISEQPRSYSYLTTTFTPLQKYLPAKLEVKVSDWGKYDGELTYQWYEFESPEKYCEIDQVTGEMKKGTPIPGADKPSYDPVKEGKIEMSGANPVAKTYYFYVVIENFYPTSTDYDPETKKSTPGATTISIQSEVSIISISPSTVEPVGPGLSAVLAEPHAPVITKQPASVSYPVGKAVSVAPLAVEAEFAVVPGYLVTPGDLRPVEDGDLSYKWFTNITYSVTGGTEIPGGNKSTYTPDLSTLKKGDHYFYVQVTYTNKIKVPTTITCLPAVITMVPSTHAAVPRIEGQPREQNVFGSDPIKPLKVEAISTDDGTLSYQWYQLDKAAAASRNDSDVIWETWQTDKDGNLVLTGGNPTRIIDNRITGATNATYTPLDAQFTNGVAYFGVEVTNYNEDATVQQKTSIKSKVVTVTKTAAYTGAAANATIQIPTGYNTFGNTSRMQYIRGYGAMDVAWANFPETEVADTELQYNPDWGLGYNILRIMVTPPGSNAGNFTSHASLILGGTPGYPIDNSAPTGGITTKHRKDFINNVKVVNKYGGYVLASPWTPPKEWKTNNSINSGGHLIPAYYNNFAGYLREFAQFMYYQGAPIYAISIANEPNYAGGYDGCEWTPVQMMNFWLSVGRFTEGVRGYGGGKYIPTVMTMNGESANSPRINDSTLDNAIARGAVDLYARHVYGEQRETLWANTSGNASFRENSDKETECWMTEHNINSATAAGFLLDSTWPYIWRFMNDVDLVIRLNNENAFVWWAGKRFYSFIGDGGSNTSKGSALPRGWGLAHYAKYSIGTRRLDLTGAITGNFPGGGAFTADVADADVNPINFGMDTTGAKITAFVSPDGNEISFVMFTPTLTTGGDGKNMGTIEIKMPGDFTIGSVKAQRSTGNADGGINPMVAVTTPMIGADRKSAFVTLGSSQILSVKITRQQE